ncbi:MAG TPA: UvrD-helicase domain-containing protein [Usitatibacter sp.]|nr:UvrD-helicase domain-containing protein [Usitatibacter sp.]
MSAVPDAAARARALDPAGSFIVQAPAGSGKTELLIQRYLVLLAGVERPEEIAAITFTRKAAAEMRRRVFDALAAAHGERPASAHQAVTHDLARAVLARDRAMGWELERNAARLRVQTIDALCVSLTRQMPVLSRFGAQPESIDDASAHYAEAARNLLAALEDEDDRDAPEVARLLAHLDNDAAQAEALLAALLAQRDPWLRHLVALPGRPEMEATLGRVRITAVRRVLALLADAPGLPALPPPEDVDAWRALAGAWLTADGKAWRKRPTAPPAGVVGIAGLREAMRQVLLLPEARYTDAQWEALDTIRRLLPRAAGELRLVFARHGQADFTEISQAALRALDAGEGPTDLMLALDYRIRHLLVDEFQDTSITQRDLLVQLTSGWEPGDGRTLFVVGDPMQSVYRFREAEVGLFLAAQREGIGTVRLEPLRLTSNFRSQAGVVEWVNEAFRGVMPPEDDAATGAVSYAPSVAVKPALGAAVHVHAFFDGDCAGEGREVARIAREALEATVPPGAPPPTVAILVRARTHLEDIVPALRAAGVPFRAVEIEPLAHRPVVQDLHALTRALSHAADRVAWLAVLRAPWAGLTLRDIEAIAAGGDPATVWERIGDEPVVASLSADGRARLAVVRTVMGRALAERARGTLRDAVEGAWMALQGPACLEGPTDLGDAEAYLAHLEAHEEAGRLPSLAEFEAGLAKLYARPDAEDAERVQLMTIHNAKGLEFDTVIVPGLHSGTARDDRKLFMWMETLEGLLLAPVNAAGGDSDPLYEMIRRLDQQKADHEGGRLLYVAATRARTALHLMGDCKRDPSGAPREPPRASLLAKLWPFVAGHFAAAPAPIAAQAGGIVAPPRGDELLRLARPATVAVPPAVRWAAPAEDARLREAIEFSWAGETARHVGSVVHRWLQRVAEDELRGWDRARITAIRPAIANELAALGVGPREVDAAAARAVAALSASLDDPRGRWVLGPHAGARNEYRISALVNGERRQLVIDRMFVHDARTWVVDYKTSSHEGADVEGFLGAEQSRYREQLERYAAVAVRGEAMLGLYFPLLRGWREWAAAAAAEDPVTE